jgi:hypothetical protein
LGIQTVVALGEATGTPNASLSSSKPAGSAKKYLWADPRASAKIAGYRYK